MFSSVGSPGGGSDVRADVSQLLEASSHPAVLAVSVGQGQSSSPATLRFDVLSNLTGGYAVSVARTALSRGDLTVALAGVQPTDLHLVLDLPTTFTTLPPAQERALGHRTGTTSSAAGDRWTTRIVVGPVGCATTGLHVGELASTVRAGARVQVARIALRVNVQRDRRLCG